MLDFLKSKPKTARPIFAPLVTDMHCHLLPRVDDGSKSEDETITCLKVLKAAGFENSIFTPHYQIPRFPNEEQDIKNRFADLKLDIASHGNYEGTNLVGIAGEYRLDTGFNDRIENSKFLLVGGRFVLVEFSLHQQVIGLDEVLFNLQMKNYEIILAHPERYPYYSSSSHVLSHFKDMGINFQINILSLSGFYGEGPRRKAFEMIDNGWVEYLGTDMHNTLYAQALIDATRDRKIEKLMEKHTFMNSKLLNPEETATKKF